MRKLVNKKAYSGDIITRLITKQITVRCLSFVNHSPCCTQVLSAMAKLHDLLIFSIDYLTNCRYSVRLLCIINISKSTATSYDNHADKMI